MQVMELSVLCWYTCITSLFVHTTRITGIFKGFKTGDDNKADAQIPHV